MHSSEERFAAIFGCRRGAGQGDERSDVPPPTCERLPRPTFPCEFLSSSPRSDVESGTDDRPGQVLWGKLDHVERSAGGASVALLDYVNVEWFERNRSSERGWLTHHGTAEHADVSIVAVAVERLKTRQLWFQIELGPGRAAAPITAFDIDLHATEVALQYHYLLGPATPRPLRSLRPARRAEAAQLGAAGSMSGLDDATPRQLKDKARRADGATSAAVYDVGQGGWNALLRQGVPVLLVDIGGGVLANLKTFPPDFNAFCFAGHPPVILSHWDWDHWSSAVRFPESQALMWLVPRQGSLGPTHAVFLAALRSCGEVHAFPDGPAHIGARLEIQQATGGRSNRNESGLAVIARNGHGQAFLFPGDAGYAVLKLPSPVTSLVVPHHGGRTRSSKQSLPLSDGLDAGRAVFSYGAGNTFRHPSKRSVELHTGWGAGLLCTAHRDPSAGTGHVELHWMAPATPTTGCGQNCPLPLPQR
jgi:hypothetical protein